MSRSSCASPVLGLLRPGFVGLRAAGADCQGLHDRAALEHSLARTGCDQGFERRVDFPKLLDFAANLLLFRHRLLLDNRAVRARAGPQRHQFLDLGQREADLLRLLDEPDAGYLLGRIDAVALALWRALDQTFPLVETHCLDIDACFSRRSCDGEGCNVWTFADP